MIELHRNDRAGLRVLDLECAVQDADLKPVVPVELGDQVSCLIAEGELLGVAREHDLSNVNTEDLALLRLALAIE